MNATKRILNTIRLHEKHIDDALKQCKCITITESHIQKHCCKMARKMGWLWYEEQEVGYEEYGQIFIKYSDDITEKDKEIFYVEDYE